jgi:hypothetical protein
VAGGVGVGPELAGAQVADAVAELGEDLVGVALAVPTLFDRGRVLGAG